MPRKAGRGADETRRMILDAAAQLMTRRGTTVPLLDVAKAAGVSKGGLLYHFRSKESLLTGLAGDLIDRFRENVDHAAAAESEGSVGRLARAYIRVSFAHADDAQSVRNYIALAAQLMFEPGLEELAARDAQRWRVALYEDGLDLNAVRVIIAAADGANTAPLWGAVLEDADRRALKEHLLSLTIPNEDTRNRESSS